MRRQLYSTFFDDKWIGQGDNRIKNAVILMHEPFTHKLNSYINPISGQRLYDIKFSKYRVFIHNNNLPVITPILSETSMYQHLEQYFSYGTDTYIKTIFESLRYTYKIHLQPFDIIPTMEKLINIISTEEILLNYVSDIKFMTNYGVKENPTGELPRVVIYLKSFNGYSSDKINTIVVNILKILQKELENYRGTGITPRYNHRVTDLIYYAQGHGLLKDKIINSDNPKMLSLLDPDSDYAHFNCNELGYPNQDCHINI
jgi:hypothetical protein